MDLLVDPDHLERRHQVVEEGSDRRSAEPCLDECRRLYEDVVVSGQSLGREGGREEAGRRCVVRIVPVEEGEERRGVDERAQPENASTT